MATKPVDPLTAVEVEIVAGLDSNFKPRALAARHAVLNAGIPFTFISGLRSRTQQTQLHQDVTRVAQSPGKSKHEIGFAFDFVGPRTDVEWLRAGAIIRDLGLESGVFYKVPDKQHVEATEARSTLSLYRALTVVAVGAALGLTINYLLDESHHG